MRSCLNFRLRYYRHATRQICNKFCFWFYDAGNKSWPNWRAVISSVRAISELYITIKPKLKNDIYNIYIAHKIRISRVCLKWNDLKSIKFCKAKMINSCFICMTANPKQEKWNLSMVFGISWNPMKAVPRKVFGKNGTWMIWRRYLKKTKEIYWKLITNLMTDIIPLGLNNLP